MTVTMHQPNYLPYLGFFDKAASADLLILLDLVDYTKNGFQNRNRIKNSNGSMWLTVPVLTKGKGGQSIQSVDIDPKRPWQEVHWRSLQVNYRKAPCWEALAPRLKPFYERPWQKLAALNTAIIHQLLEILGIHTRVVTESELDSEASGTERLVQLCKRVGATDYLSGAGGRDYLEENRFAEAGIGLHYQDYRHPVYRQQYKKHGFIPDLSVLDLLFNEGPSSLNILRGKTR